MATPAQWIEGARPRTLPAAVAPVIVGLGAAYPLGRANYAYALLALLVALFLQIGVNYANDYSDGIRGTDAERVGPVRLVGQRLADPANVKLMAFLCFGLAGLAGLALVALSGAVALLPLGVLSVLAAWRYTGGDNPYGYRAMGEVYVFVFFGLVATLGTLYAMAHRLTWVGLLGAVGIGAIITAILVANNLRDIPSDTATGKHTLAVRLGDKGTRRLYLALIVLPLLCAGAIGLWHVWALLALASLVLAVRPTRVITSGATGPALIPVLLGTGLYAVAWAVLLAVGLAVS
ncbi:MAG: 1,4-dihydroxy-2-naphthoate polyprenyltransferase [Micrococcales bacterium]|nr:1,4-dihydroxy-2-naphthoate polyprenyltransferase [Micrococcales bacterium]